MKQRFLSLLLAALLALGTLLPALPAPGPTRRRRTRTGGWWRR